MPLTTGNYHTDAKNLRFGPLECRLSGIWPIAVEPKRGRYHDPPNTRIRSVSSAWRSALTSSCQAAVLPSPVGNLPLTHAHATGCSRFTQDRGRWAADVPADIHVRDRRKVSCRPGGSEISAAVPADDEARRLSHHQQMTEAPRSREVRGLGCLAPHSERVSNVA